MPINFVKYLILLSVLLLPACSSVPHVDDTAQLNKALASSQARLKIYRPGEYSAPIEAGARVKIDGREVANLDTGASTILDLPAGKHQIVVDHWSHPNVYKLDLVTKPGHLYRLEITPREEAAVAGALLGMTGVLIEAAANENGGTFQIRLVEDKPLRG